LLCVVVACFLSVAALPVYYDYSYQRGRFSTGSSGELSHLLPQWCDGVQVGWETLLTAQISVKRDVLSLRQKSRGLTQGQRLCISPAPGGGSQGEGGHFCGELRGCSVEELAIACGALSRGAGLGSERSGGSEGRLIGAEKP